MDTVRTKAQNHRCLQSGNRINKQGSGRTNVGISCFMKRAGSHFASQCLIDVSRNVIRCIYTHLSTIHSTKQQQLPVFNVVNYACKNLM